MAVMRQARRRAHQEFAPVRAESNIARRRATTEKTQNIGGTKRIYGGANQAMGAIGSSINPAFKQTRQGYLSGIGKASDLIGGGGSVAAATAAGNMMGAETRGTLGSLSRQQGAANAYNAGMGEAMQNQGANLQTQYMLDYRSKLEEIEARERATAAQESARAAEIAESMRAERANKRLEKWMMNYLQGLQNPGGGGPQGGQPDQSLSQPGGGWGWEATGRGPGGGGGQQQFQPGSMQGPQGINAYDQYNSPAPATNQPGGMAWNDPRRYYYDPRYGTYDPTVGYID